MLFIFLRAGRVSIFFVLDNKVPRYSERNAPSHDSLRSKRGISELRQLARNVSLMFLFPAFTSVFFCMRKVSAC